MRCQLSKSMRRAGVAEPGVEVGPSIFLRSEWFEVFEQFVRHSDGSTRNLSLYDAGRMIAQLPLYQDFSTRARRLHSLTNYYSPTFRLLSDSHSRGEGYQSFVEQFRRYFVRFDQIDLVPLFEADAQYFQDAFERIGFRAFVYRYSTNWYNDNIVDLDSFWRARPSRLRNTIKTKSQKLVRKGGVCVEVVQPSSKLDLWKYLAHFHQVYFASWKQAEPYPAFVDAIAELAWARGELRLGMAYHGSVPVAAQIWFVCGATASIFKLAYRPEYASCSIGTVLSKVLFDHVIEKDRVTCIDYLTGNDQYKADWMSSHRALFGVQLCNMATCRGISCFSRNRLSSLSRELFSKSSQRIME